MFARRFSTAALAAVLALGLAACDDSATEPGPVDIVELASASGLNTLIQAAQAAGLDDDLAGPGPFTIFAPTDDAFAALGTTLDALLQDPQALAEVLLYHVVAGRYTTDDLADLGSLETLGGYRVAIEDGAVNGVDLNTAELEASNGIVHVISTVLLPPESNIVETAVATPDLSTLVTAVVTAGLADDLAADGPFTVFAPTNAAFDALPSGTVPTLLGDLPALTDVLTYHVVPGAVFSGDLSNGSVTTLQGADLTIAVTASGITVNGVNVVVDNIITTNGVVHLIDGVLLPPAN